MLVYLNPIEYKNRRSCCFNSCNALFSTLMAFSGLLLIYLHLQKRLRYLKMIFLQRPKGKEGRLLAWFTFSPWSLRRESLSLGGLVWDTACYIHGLGEQVDGVLPEQQRAVRPHASLCHRRVAPGALPALMLIQARVALVSLFLHCSPNVRPWCHACF